MSVGGPFPKDVKIKLIGTQGVTLKIVLIPTSYGRPKLENVVIEACYTAGIYRDSLFKNTIILKTTDFVAVKSLF